MPDIKIVAVPPAPIARIVEKGPKGDSGIKITGAEEIIVSSDEPVDAPDGTIWIQTF